MRQGNETYRATPVSSSRTERVSGMPLALAFTAMSTHDEGEKPMPENTDYDDHKLRRVVGLEYPTDDKSYRVVAMVAVAALVTTGSLLTKLLAKRK